VPNIVDFANNAAGFTPFPSGPERKEVIALMSRKYTIKTRKLVLVNQGSSCKHAASTVCFQWIIDSDQ
jgi:hypothetical protein